MFELFTFNRSSEALQRKLETFQMPTPTRLYPVQKVLIDRVPQLSRHVTLACVSEFNPFEDTSVSLNGHEIHDYMYLFISEPKDKPDIFYSMFRRYKLLTYRISTTYHYFHIFNTFAWNVRSVPLIPFIVISSIVRCSLLPTKR